MAAASGGNILQGMAMGALSGFLTCGIGQMFSAVAGVTASTSAFEVAGINAAAAFAAGTITGFISGGKGSAVFRNAAIGAGVAFGMTMMMSGGSGEAQAASADDPQQVAQSQSVVTTNTTGNAGGNLNDAGIASQNLAANGISPEINVDPLKYSLDTFKYGEDTYAKNLFATHEYEYSTLKFSATSIAGDTFTLSSDSASACFGGGTALSRGALGVSAEFSAHAVEVSGEIHLFDMAGTKFSLYESAGLGAKASFSALITQTGGKVGVGGGLGPTAGIELRFRKIE